MKKLIAILTALCLALTLTAAFAEQAAPNYVVQEGIQFGMNRETLIGQLGTTMYKIDTEHTHGDITFTEVEIEDTNFRGKRADVHFVLYNDVLVAAQVEFDDGAVNYDELLESIKKDVPDAVTYDLAELGKKIYALDDDGRLEGRAQAFEWEKKLLVIEQDKDDVKLYMLDLNWVI